MPTMQLKVLLPFRVFSVTQGLSSIVAETGKGAFGLLPRRLDCVAALIPGILSITSQTGAETFLAVDAGVLVKTGADVLVSVRRAISGNDLGLLRAAVEKEFLDLNEQEKEVQTVMAKLETGFLRRFAAISGMVQ